MLSPRPTYHTSPLSQILTNLSSLSANQKKKKKNEKFPSSSPSFVQPLYRREITSIGDHEITINPYLSSTLSIAVHFPQHQPHRTSLATTISVEIHNLTTPKNSTIKHSQTLLRLQPRRSLNSPLSVILTTIFSRNR